jgi:16S rRNA (guanine(1405)-N(7))-methyltransferase
MPDAHWHTSECVCALARRIATKATRDYRVSADDAERIIREVIARSPACRAAAAEATDPDRLARTRAFKDAASRAREKIYYSLRQYRTDAEGAKANVAALEELADDATPSEREEATRRVMQGHASTRERIENCAAFYEQVFSLAGEPQSIIDIGCGVQPLAFPFDGLGSSVEVYIAADKDAAAVRAVNAHARFLGPGRLRALAWDIADGWEPLVELAGVETFDLALMLKLVPVVKRLDPSLLETLARAPAKLMLVTGAAMSMTKRKSVRRRERGVLRRYIKEAHLEIAGELETPDEVGWMVARA